MSLQATAGDELLRTVSADGGIAARVLCATDLVREATYRHGTAPTASAALGRTLMASVLLAAGAKDAETVQLQLCGDGEIGQLTAIADGAGHARGYAQNPLAHLPPRAGKLDVRRAVGRGVLGVVRYHPSWRGPYRGIVPIVSGEIAEDVAHYLTESEQTPSALALGVFVGPDADVEAAGGYLIQALPGAEIEGLERVERTVLDLPSPTELLRSGHDAEEILTRLLAAEGMRDVHRRRPRFHCSCDLERIRRAVVLLGREETREIFEGGEQLEVRCEFCATSYRLSPDEVGALFPDS